MPEQSLEQLLQMAKERSAKAANRPIEEAQQKTARIIGEIEQGAPEHVRAMSEHAVAAEKVNQADAEVESVNTRIQSVATDRAAINTDPNYEALRNDPELFGQALAHLQEREDVLQTELKEKAQGQTEAKGAKKLAGEKQGAISDKAKAYMGEKEIPKQKLDETWKYVEYQRGLNERVSGFDAPHTRGERAAESFIYELTEGGDTTRGTQLLLDEKNDGDFYAVAVLSKPMDNPHYAKAELSPKLYNDFVSGVVNKINQAITEKKFQGYGYGPAKPLTETQLETLRNGKLTLTYQGEVRPVWDAGKAGPMLEEKTPESISQLTPNEQSVVQEVIKDRRKSKDDLLKELKMSEYSPEADEHFRGQAGAENAEYNRKKLEEKLPELEVGIRSLTERESEKQNELKPLEDLRKRVENYPKVQTQVLNLRGNRDYYSSSIASSEARLDNVKREREGLPQKSRILGGGPKDKNADQRLAAQIADLEKTIQSTQSNLSETETQLKPLEQQLETEKQEIQKIEAGAFDAQGKLTLQSYEVDNKKRTVEFEIQKIQQARKRTEKVKELWEQGKFLNLSSQEAQMVAPEAGGAEIDRMASSIAPQMDKYFDQYSNWQRFPDTSWTIKNGELKRDGANWGDTLHSGDWNGLANLHSEQLSSLLAEKVRQQLGKKFGSKVGNIKIMVE